MKSVYKSTWPYQGDEMNLPVENVDNAETAFAELEANGLKKEAADFRIDKYGDKKFKVFFVVAPDGLCYCLGERQP